MRKVLNVESYSQTIVTYPQCESIVNTMDAHLDGKAPLKMSNHKQSSKKTNKDNIYFGAKSNCKLISLLIMNT